MLLDGGCVNDLVLLSVVCDTSVFGSWYPLGVGVGSSGKALEMGNGIAWLQASRGICDSAR